MLAKSKILLNVYEYAQEKGTELGFKVHLLFLQSKVRKQLKFWQDEIYSWVTDLIWALATERLRKCETKRNWNLQDSYFSWKSKSLIIAERLLGSKIIT